MTEKAASTSLEERARREFEDLYPCPIYAIKASGEAGKFIHYSHLKREWEGFQKGWAAAIRAYAQPGEPRK